MRLRSWACCVSLLGCAAAPRAPIATGSPSPSPAPVRVVIPSRIVQAGASGEPALVERSADGTERLVAGGYRFERAPDGAVTVAEIALADPIVAALANADGWSFVTATERYEAPGFLAALRRTAGHAEGRIARGCGLPVFVAHASTDSLRLPYDGVLLDAACGDSRRCVAIMEPGAAFATDDAGSTWHALALHDDAALAVLAAPTVRWVIAGETALRVDSAGNVTEVPRATAPELRTSEDPAQRGAVHVAEEHDAARALERAIPRGASFDGRVVSVWNGRVFEYDPARDEITFPPAPLCEPSDLFATDRLYARCLGAGTAHLQERSADGSWRMRLSADTNGDDDAPACVAAADGPLVACAGMCITEDNSAATATTACVRRGDEPARDESAPEGALVGIDGDGVIALGGVSGGDVLLSRGTQHVEPAGAYEWSLHAARIDRDRRLRLPVRREAGRPGWIEGRVGGAMLFHEAPPTSRLLAVGTDAHAMSITARGELEQTDDEGAHWAALPIAPDAVESTRDVIASAVHVANATSFVCGDVGCRFATGIARIGWGPTAASRFGALGRGAIARSEPPDEPTAWRCEAATSALRVPEPAPPVVGPGTSFLSSSAAGTLAIRESPAPRARGGVRVEATWQPAPLSRPSDARAWHARFPLDRFYAQSEVHPTRWTAIHVSNTAATALRCGAGPAGIAPQCDVIRFAAHGPARILASVPVAPVVAAHSDDTLAILGLDPHAVTDPTAPYARSGWLLVVRGESAAQRVPVTLSREAEGAWGPYAFGTEAGIARARTDGTTWLEPVGGVPHVLATRRTRDVCAPDARGEIALIARGALIMGNAGTRELAVTTRYAMATDALCLRGLDARVEQLGDPGWLAAAPGLDGIYGMARTHDEMAPVHCIANVR